MVNSTHENYKFFRRIDAAVHAFRGREVHWNKQGFPYQVVRTSRGTFKKQDIPTVIPIWTYRTINWFSKLIK